MKRILKLAAVVAVWTSSGIAVAADELSARDEEFLRNAAQLGLTEVAMGKLAQKRGGSHDVKEHGAMMVSVHSAGNKELSALAKAKGVDLNLKLAGRPKQTISALSESSGSRFDKAYVEVQAKDHRIAIDMFQDAVQEAKDPDVKAFAEKHLPNLQRHLAVLPRPSSARITGIHPQERRGTGGESARPSRKQRRGASLKAD